MLHKKQKIEHNNDGDFNTPPACVNEFLTIIKDNIDPVQLINLLKTKSFRLYIVNGEERKLTPEQFAPMHDHCFGTPMLALCHIASEHDSNISDQVLFVLIKHLVELGADVQATDESGNTPLLLLASSDNHRQPLKKTINYLIKQGADINQANHAGQTVLHFAYEAGNFALADILLEFGAVVALNKKQRTCLSEFVRSSSAVAAEFRGAEGIKIIDQIEKLGLLNKLDLGGVDEFKLLLDQYPDEITLEEIKRQLESGINITKTSLQYAFFKINDENLNKVIIKHLDKKLAAPIKKDKGFYFENNPSCFFDTNRASTFEIPKNIHKLSTTERAALLEKYSKTL